VGGAIRERGGGRAPSNVPRLKELERNPISAQKCCNYFSTFKHFQSAVAAAAVKSAVIIRAL